MGKEVTLDNKGREIFRKRISTRLKDIDFNPKHRITLPKERLKELLFDLDDFGRNVFSYYDEGLCKIDLSGVDFTKVIFTGKEKVDLSNTNIKIDFSKFNPTGLDGAIHHIENIDFSNVDLSKSFKGKDKTHSYEFKGCNLSNTNLKLGTKQFGFKNCDLSGVDLSFTTLTCTRLIFDGSIVMFNNSEPTANDYNIVINNCNLSDTKANIAMGDSETLSAQVTYGAHGALHKVISVNVKDYLAKQIAAGKLNGVNFVGFTIEPRVESPKEEKRRIADQKRRLAWEKNLSAVINSTLDIIDREVDASVGGREVNKKKQGPKKLELTMPTDEPDDLSIKPFNL